MFVTRPLVYFQTTVQAEYELVSIGLNFLKFSPFFFIFILTNTRIRCIIKNMRAMASSGILYVFVSGRSVRIFNL